MALGRDERGRQPQVLLGREPAHPGARRREKPTQKLRTPFRILVLSLEPGEHDRSSLEQHEFVGVGLEDRHAG